MFKKWSSTLYVMAMVTLGTFLFAIGINAFVVPHKLVSGGISGVALMLYYLTGIQVGTLNLLLNIPVLYAAYRWLGRWHVMITIFGTVVSSLFINMLRFLADYDLTHDPLVGAILGGLFCGIGVGTVYRSGGNAGGLDPIALIIRKYYGLQIGSIVLAINMVILTIAAFVVNIEAAAVTLVSLYISAMLTNRVIVGFDQRKAVFIISYKPYKICDLIINQIGRGATILNGEGAYTHQHKQVILVVVSLMQVAKLKKAVEEEDPTAFLMVTDVAEVIGAGFTLPSKAETQQAIERIRARVEMND
ncbi:YitT family protein [Veillonella sp. R32]|uniref:YitT family protein n=1 Tax=Veillonella sp. R32 TaxID=2021312 RepID=UPI001389DA7B|nr:YitT family protein [Veillonella sp. R32]KAF1683374.1 membrane protein [Veillonella sp. R32]